MRSISERKVGRMSQASLGGPPQVEAYLSPELRGCLRRNWPDHLARGISEPKVGRMSQARLGGPPQVEAYLSTELRGCLGRNCLKHLRPGHIRAQSCKDVSRETRQTTSCAAYHLRSEHIGAQSCEDVSFKTAWTTSCAVSRSPELRGYIRRN